MNEQVKAGDCLNSLSHSVDGLRLTNAQAYALAELCKRITWTHCAELSVDSGECEMMLQATNEVRAALAANGWHVR